MSSVFSKKKPRFVCIASLLLLFTAVSATRFIFTAPTEWMYASGRTSHRNSSRLPSLAKRTSVAVIGASGYIGSCLLGALQSSGMSVRGFDRDSKPLSHAVLNELIEFSTPSSAISTEVLRSFEVVIYLGGYTGRAVCDRFPDDVRSENVDDILRLSRRMTKRQLLIFASTSAILEGAGSLPVDENWIVKEELLDNYSASMYRREKALQHDSVSRPNSPRFVGLRFGTVIGSSPSQRQEMAYMAFVKSAFTAGSLDVRHPETARSFLAMTDLQSAIVEVVKGHHRSDIKYEIFHLSSFMSLIGKVAAEVAAVTGAHIRQHSHRGPDVVGFSLSTVKFEKAYNFHFQGSSRALVEELTVHAKGVVVGRNKPDSPRLVEPSLINVCGVCGRGNEHDVVEVLDLGKQPLANDFRTEVQDSMQSERFPLRLILCKACYHVQLSHTVDRGSLFSNYLYRSGTTTTLKEHFNRLAHKIDEAIKTPEGRRKRVLEIACNDGSQLNQFKKLGWDTYGADPAKNIVQLAQAEGHNVKVGFWGVDDFSDILPDHLDAIVAQNVLAHVPDPMLFLQACAKHMNQATLLYIQTSQCDMFETGQFDTTYHEHIHFFTAHSFASLAQLTGLHIIDFDIVSIHGRSCLVTFKKAQGDDAISFTMQQRLTYEKELGLTHDMYFAKFKHRAISVQTWVNDQLRRLYAQGHRVVGYGAAAKGIVLLHTLLARTEQEFVFDFIIDDEPLKQGRYCPGTSIPVQQSTKLSSIDSDVVIVVFAWNFESEIREHILSVMSGTSHSVKLLVPFPEQRLYEVHAAQRTSTLLGTNTYSPRPLPLPFPSGRRQVVLYSHFYNEELLAPYWIQHHASMFDKAYIFDYSSSDNTAKLFEKYAPSTWIIKQSVNKDFGANEVDAEIMESESLCDNCWKIALTTTEFLIHPNLRDFLANQDVVLDGPRYFEIPMYQMVDDEYSKTGPLKRFDSLISQRHQWSPLGTSGHLYTRFLHNFFAGEYNYSVGRHAMLPADPTAKFSLIDSAAIFKYKYAPWPEVQQRLSQIGKRIPESERGILGYHHTAYEQNHSRILSDYDYFRSTLYDAFDVEYCVSNITTCLPSFYCLSCKVRNTLVTYFEHT